MSVSICDSSPEPLFGVALKAGEDPLWDARALGVTFSWTVEAQQSWNFVHVV